ncbi:nuclear transport factor 2 family protein [Longimicrobium sp.]|uniref:nuclear transport factor 2 family protein n=1 Tax=Longimicrobium sp. TaxID=2029185 RepID=UPI002E33312E|nr:nuclear transport factor 2 family protein [Longimicrobium sp.]HEX6038498.1 nuclear transport factor 2 family protein [Longimicrobium sp.]
MRRLFAVLLALPLAVACQAQTSPAPSAAPAGPPRETSAQEREAVLATLQSFMNALRMRDTAAMNVHVDSLTRMTLIRPRREGGTRVVVMTAPEFIRAVTQPGQPGIDEPIRNPVVQVSGDLATVWAEYQVRRPDNTVSHCGFDAFHLVRREGQWKLLNISDTFQNSGCGPAWPD